MRHLILILTLTAIASCGWHLRGVTPLPEGYRVIHVSGEPRDVRNSLIEHLEFNDVVVPQSAIDAPVNLKITDYEVERRTLSVNALGQVAEYEFTARLTVKLTRTIDPGMTDASEMADAPAEAVPAESREITTEARRILSNDVNNVVATAAEEATLRNTLRSELITRLMRRLQRLEQTP